MFLVRVFVHQWRCHKHTGCYCSLRHYGEIIEYYLQLQDHAVALSAQPVVEHVVVVVKLSTQPAKVHERHQWT